MSEQNSPESSHPDVKSASWAAKFFLLKPTFGLLLAILIGIGGIMAYISLVKESLPDLAIPQATVTTFYPGADPQTVEQGITEPIERELATLRGVKTTSSASFDSYSIIAVEFVASADLSESMQLLRAKLDDAEAELPSEAESPEVNQVSVDDRPIISIVLYGDVGDRALSRVANNLEDRLEGIEGVNEVDIGGQREEVVQIQLNPERILALGISPAVVRNAVQQANLDTPLGEIENQEIGSSLRLYGRFRDVESLRNLPITRISEGRLVRLKEIADVRRDLERVDTRASFSFDGSDFAPGIEISVKKVPGSDTIAVIESVRAEIEEAVQGQDWPQAVSYRITQDESDQIMNSLTDVLNNGWQAMLAVFIILFVLLSWREGLIAGLCVPLTFLGALVIIWAVGFTLNELVIIGMVLALGLLVDVFILMMEGLHEAIFVENMSFGQAALTTVRKYAIPAAAGQATTILALAPLMAVSGVAGKFIRVLPATAIICLAMAFIVALLIAVPLSRYLMGHVTKKEDRSTRVDKITAVVSAKLRDASLVFTLRNRWVAAGWSFAALIIFVVSLGAFTQVPMVMYTKGDGLKLGVNVELPPTTTLVTSQQVANDLGALLSEKDYLESVVMLVGKKSPFASVSLGDSLRPSVGENFVGFSATFVEREDRDAPGYVYAEELRAEISSILDHQYAGATFVVVPETGQPSNEAPVQVNLSGSDMDELQRISKQIQTALTEIPGTVGVHDNLGSVKTEINLIPRREALDFYGLTTQDIASQVRYAMSVGEIGKFSVSGLEDDLPIQLSLAWPSRKGSVGGPTRIEELSMVRAFTPEGESVPLLSLLEPRIDLVPLSITHKNGDRSIAVLSEVEGVPANKITDALLPRLEEMSKDWPSGYRYSIGGEVEEAAETFASAGIMLVIAIVLVFGLLVLLFGSFRQSFVIIFTMPLALIGTFIGFYILNLEFSFFAMVGLISLIGIVVNDAIVMVDTMNSYLRNGAEVRVAAAHGAADRLRPIISTSLTTIVGLIPLAITNAMWRPICFAIIFGLLASTVISLVVIPCLYYLLSRKSMAEETDLN